MPYLDQFRSAFKLDPHVSSHDLPLSMGQYAIWLEQELYPADTANHAHFVAKIEDHLDVEAFQRAVWDLSEQHEVIRTIFPVRNGVPIRHIVAPQDIKIQIFECADLSEKTVFEMAQNYFEKPFNLREDPPHRFCLYRMSSECYYLQIIQHHIATALSYASLIVELIKLYACEKKNPITKPPATQGTFSDFVCRHWQHLQSDSSLASREYWKQYLSGSLPHPTLPLISTSTSFSDFSSCVYHLDLEPELVDKLTTICRDTETTFFSLTVAAFKVLLSCYTGQEEMIIGVPNDTRRTIEAQDLFKNLIGYTTNTLPLRTKCTKDESFYQFLKKVRANMQSMGKHRVYPLMQINEDRRQQNPQSTTELFKTLAVSQRTDEHKEIASFGVGKKNISLNIDGVKLTSTGIGLITTGRFDLAMALVKTCQGEVVSFHYNKKIFDKKTIQMLSNNYITLLHSIAENPNKTLAELEYISHDEKKTLLEDWACVETFKISETFLEGFAKNTEIAPTATAIVCGQQSIDYQTLNSLSDKLARHLHKLSVSQETVIGISMERSIKLVVAILAVMKSGGAFLPLDPTLPQERIAFMLEDSQAQLLLTDSHSSLSSRKEIQRVNLDTDWESILEESETGLEQDLSGDRLSYILYTSGSTGQPKGVEICQSALDNFLTAIQKQLRLSKNDQWLGLTTISFDISLLEILLPLSQGATLLFVDQETAKDPILLAKIADENAVTHMQATPTMWQMLLNTGWKGKKGLIALCGGEALDKTLAEELLSFVTSLWNMYGPTETTIWSSMKQITLPIEKITIGQPIMNTSFYVLDEKQHIVPIGVPGELYIGGAGLARGYRNQPDLSQKKFVQPPFTNASNTKLYRTGDVVRYLPNGEIEFVGRLDNQVKLHGHRIELGEIEESIKTCPDVRQAAVVIREDKPTKKHLIAYYVGDVKSETIRQHLIHLLPYYMLPHLYIQLNHLPTSPSGKIDRKALPLPNYEVLEENYIAPRDALEENIEKILSTILGIDRVSVHANFFSLGGHSLTAAQVVSEINRTFYINLPLKVIFNSSSIELLAEEVRYALIGKKNLNLISNAPKDISIPLTIAQNQFCFLDQLQEGTANYTIPFLIDLKGPLDHSALNKALDEIISRHSILRTYIMDMDGELEQKTHPVITQIVQFINLEGCEYSKIVSQHIKEIIAYPFKLAQGPLFRFVLFRENNLHHQLFLHFHHIIFDGYSVNVFLDELTNLYRAYRRNISDPLSPLQIQYSDYAYWQHQSQNAPSESDLLWWVKKLEGASCVLNIPTDKSRPHTLSSEGALLEMQLLTFEELHELKQLAQSHNATLFTVLLAAFHIFLYKYTGENDTIIGIPVSGRSHSQLNNLIGCFVNTLPIRISSHACESFHACLELIKQEVLDSFEHQEVTLERLVDKLSIQRSLSYSSLFQVMFNLLPGIPEENMDHLEITISQVDRGCSHLDLSLTAQETTKGLDVFFEYSTDLFIPETIQRMGKHFQSLLKCILKQPSCSIANFSILSDAEMKMQVLDWNKKLENYTDEKTIPQMLEEWALNTPDALAVVCGTTCLTFTELNAFANQIAHHLLSRGIKKEDRVVIYAERSVEFIGATLGVLKAGATYVPIDPKEPKNRRETILNELQPFCVLGPKSSYSNGLTFNYIALDELLKEPTCNPSVEICKNQLAYIIFTSGSTGRPKGVEIEHQSICDRIHWKNAAYPLSLTDAVLHTYSFIFDGAIINYFWPICFGAKLIISTSEEQYDGVALVNLINRHRVSIVDLLPSLLHGLLEDEQISSCTSLKIVFSGGEALSGELIKLFYQSLSAKLINTYGPTEATVEASAFECKPNDDIYSIVPIGRQIAGANLYILDGDKNIAPIGVAGELYIGGAGLARGYFKNPTLTAEKFVNLSASSHIQERLYRTGDLVRYQTNGNIEFLGRIDNQIKIRGFRVEIAEIEAALLHIDPIEKAVVTVKGDALHKRLVAYVILSLKMTESSLLPLIKHYLSNRLPAYMIPQQVVIVEKFPTLSNGKVNYKALPEPAIEQKELCTIHPNSFKTHLEGRLHECWSQILHCNHIAPSDNFFELGGNSLLAMKLVGRLKRELGIQIPLAYLFQYPTIASLAKKLQQNGHEIWSPIVKLCEEGYETPFFIVHPIGGGILCYSALAKNWNTDRPLYAIQALGLEEGQSPLLSVKAMAKNYIKEIQKIQPEGPYLVGGWSFGGIVATEIVNQLTQMNETVDLLLLIDTSANIDTFRQINLNDDALLLAELSQHYLDTPLTDQTNTSFKDRLANFIENGGERSLNHEKSTIDRLIALARANYMALQAYYIPILQTKVALIRAQQNFEKQHDLGWSKYVSDISVNICPGNHWAITSDQHALQYVSTINHCLDSISKAKKTPHTSPLLFINLWN